MSEMNKALRAIQEALPYCRIELVGTRSRWFWCNTNKFILGVYWEKSYFDVDAHMPGGDLVTMKIYSVPSLVEQAIRSATIARLEL